MRDKRKAQTSRERLTTRTDERGERERAGTNMLENTEEKATRTSKWIG